MNASTTNLLRRTAVALAAVAGLYAADSHAAVVTLSGVNGNSCTYSSMSVAPDGGFTVSCQSSPGTTPTTPVPGTLGLGAQGDVTVGTPVTINAFRSGGSSGAVAASYGVSGAGCAAGSGTVSWADGETASKPIAVTTTAAGPCTATLSGPTGGATLGTASITFNVTAVAVNTSCPAGFTAPADLISSQLGGVGNPLLAMAKSGQVVSLPLPATAAGYSTGQIAFSESAGGAYTPQPVTLSISISKCKGLVDTDQSNRCNISSTNGNYNSITWFSQAYSIIRDAASAGLRGYCWAPASEGPWYINAKWTYSQCAFGAQQCGFAVQQNYGPY